MKLMGYKRITVAQHQRALLLTNSVLTDILGPDVHQWLDLTDRVQVQVHDLTGAELVHPQAQVYRNDAAALWDAHVLTVQTAADEAALIMLDGQPAALVPPGSQRFYWKGPVRVDVERIGLGADPALAPALLARLPPLLRQEMSTKMAASRAGAAGLPVARAAAVSEHLYLEEVPDQHVAAGLKPIQAKHPTIQARWQSQLGSLGGGNHFIELCLDEAGRVWIMLHSGSRGIGNRIGQYFIEQAKREIERWHVQLPDQNLAYLPEGSDLFDDYVQAVGWAQDYALENRRQMMRLILEALRDQVRQGKLPPFEVTDEAIECHHNYVAREHHFGKDVLLTRKGAIRARDGDLGIIPGSMGARSYIVRGKGNPESFCSCAHGAGRRMSRSEAKRRFTRKDLAQQTLGVECRKDKGVLDEIPGAYKDIDAVMANQTDLVVVAHTLKQVLTVKG